MSIPARDSILSFIPLVRRLRTLAGLFIGLLAIPGMALGQTAFFFNYDPTIIPGLEHPNSDNARDAFLAGLDPTFISHEDFEALSVGTIPTSGLQVPLSSTPDTMQISRIGGGSGFRVSDDLTSPNSEAFAISGSQYLTGLAIGGGDFLEFTFSTPQNAFGLYGQNFVFDDFGTNLTIKVSLDGGTPVDVGSGSSLATPIPSVTGYSDAISYFGVVSPTPFTSVKLINPPVNLGVGIDDVTVGRFFSPAAIDVASASSTQDAFVSGSQTTTGSGLVQTYKSLDIRPGAIFTIAPEDTVVVTDGPLYVAPGAILNGNGIVDGDILNSGLVRIGITATSNISSISGGIVRIVLPEPPVVGQPILIDPPPTQNPIEIDGDTFVSFLTSDGGSGGGGGGGGGGTGSGGFSGESVIWTGPGLSVDGTFSLDASLEVTGSYTQTDTGVLRLFIAGDVHEPGNERYSVLTVGEGVSLAGSIQVVLQPELFNFLPSIGDTFDVIRSPQGITLDPDLLLLSLVTTEGASYLGDFVTQIPFDSGFVDDPDQLNLLDPGLWQMSLVDNDTILRLQYVGVPEPSSLALATIAAFSFLAFRIRRRSN